MADGAERTSFSATSLQNDAEQEADADNPAIVSRLQSKVSCGGCLISLGIIEHHEKNDRKDIVCYLHRFCVWQSKRADECLATVAGTHASADLAGSRS